MGYLYQIPKKYLFDKPEPQDFRHLIASRYADYLMNYFNMNDLNAFYMGLYGNALYFAVQNHNPYDLLSIYKELYTLRYRDAYENNIPHPSSDEFAAYIVEWFNNETYSYIKSYYEEQMKRQ